MKYAIAMTVKTTAASVERTEPSRPIQFFVESIFAGNTS